MIDEISILKNKIMNVIYENFSASGLLVVVSFFKPKSFAKSFEARSTDKKIKIIFEQQFLP